MRRLSSLDIFRRIKTGKMMVQDLVGLVTLDPFRTLVPGSHVSCRIEHEDRVIPYALDESSRALLTFTQGLFHLLAFGDVACDRIDESLLGHGNRIPQEPSIGTVFTAIAVLKSKSDFPVLQPAGFGTGRCPVVGMDELQVGFGHEFVGRIAQGLFPAWVQTLEVAIEVLSTEHVN